MQERAAHRADIIVDTRITAVQRAVITVHIQIIEVTTLIRLAVVLQTAVIQGLIPVIIITRAAHLMAMVIYREGVVLGIISIVCWVFTATSFIGLITGIIGLICSSSAKKAGFKGGIQTAGFVCSLIGVIGGAIVLVACVACVGILGTMGAIGEL